MNQHEINILLKARDEASRVVDDVEKKAGGLGNTLKTVGTVAGGFLAANVVSAGVGALTGFIGDSIAAVKESIQVNAQLEAVLESTGGAANVTGDHVRELAGRWEKYSLFEDEAIINGQNLLLTFTNVSNAVDGSSTVFDDATRIMLDMAQALGTDASGSAIMLGKALNDPVQGISALTRVGVTFTEAQKEQIKAMQEAGDVAGAQNVILQELGKEFGGSAQAASDAAGASERYKDRMNDLQEEIGAKMLPVNEKLMEAKLALVNILATKVIPVIEELYVKHWPSIQKVIQDVVAFVQEHWPLFSAIIEFVANDVRVRIEGIIQTIQGIVQVIEGVINLVTALFHGDWAAAWDAMVQIASGIIDILLGTIERTFGSIPGIILNAIGDLGSLLYNTGADLASGLINGIKDALRNFKISINIGGVDLGPLGSTPSVSATIYPFRFARGVRGFGGGWAWVGEEGPELLQLPMGSNVYNSRDSQRMAGRGDVIVNINGPVYGDQSRISTTAGNLGWMTSLELARRGA